MIQLQITNMATHNDGEDGATARRLSAYSVCAGVEVSINDAVAKRLKELAVGLKEFAAAEKNGTTEVNQ